MVGNSHDLAAKTRSPGPALGNPGMFTDLFASSFVQPDVWEQHVPRRTEHSLELGNAVPHLSGLGLTLRVQRTQELGTWV